MDEIKERAVLCGICMDSKDEYKVEQSLNELRELAFTAGAEVVGTAVQNKAEPEAATFLGSGKLKEIAEQSKLQDASLLVFDDELSGTQIKNIEAITELRVIDRTSLILDIFAQRARSREGRLQVELAQLQYLMPRLTGLRSDLSRLGGGIGTRGPGETKLESDRRHLRRRINALERNIDEISKRRNLLRSRRGKEGFLTVAIVGYTNAGKSTLINVLTGSDIMAEDMLFATLDPSVRGIKLEDGRKVLFVDTVGFIRKLPHHLINAFRSTLEEAEQADLILNICDASDPDAQVQLETSDSILKELHCEEKPQLVVLNKSDLSSGGIHLPGRETVSISAKTHEGLPALLEKIGVMLPGSRKHLNLLLPYDKAGLVDKMISLGEVLKTDYTEEGIRVDGYIDARWEYLISDYEI